MDQGKINNFIFNKKTRTVVGSVLLMKFPSPGIDNVKALTQVITCNNAGMLFKSSVAAPLTNDLCLNVIKKLLLGRAL